MFYWMFRVVIGWSDAPENDVDRMMRKYLNFCLQAASLVHSCGPADFDVHMSWLTVHTAMFTTFKGFTEVGLFTTKFSDSRHKKLSHHGLVWTFNKNLYKLLNLSQISVNEKWEGKKGRSMKSCAMTAKACCPALIWLGMVWHGRFGLDEAGEALAAAGLVRVPLAVRGCLAVLVSTAAATIHCCTALCPAKTHKSTPHPAASERSDTRHAVKYATPFTRWESSKILMLKMS